VENEGGHAWSRMVPQGRLVRSVSHLAQDPPMQLAYQDVDRVVHHPNLKVRVWIALQNRVHAKHAPSSNPLHTGVTA